MYRAGKIVYKFNIWDAISVETDEKKKNAEKSCVFLTFELGANIDRAILNEHVTHMNMVFGKWRT